MDSNIQGLNGQAAHVHIHVQGGVSKKQVVGIFFGLVIVKALISAGFRKVKAEIDKNA